MTAPAATAPLVSAPDTAVPATGAPASGVPGLAPDPRGGPAAGAAGTAPAPPPQGPRARGQRRGAEAQPGPRPPRRGAGGLAAAPPARSALAADDRIAGLPVRRDGDLARVVVVGEVDRAACDALVGAVDVLVAQHVRTVLVDVTRVPRVHGDVPRLLLRQHWRLHRHGGRVRLVGASPEVLRTVRWAAAQELLA